MGSRATVYWVPVALMLFVVGMALAHAKDKKTQGEWDPKSTTAVFLSLHLYTSVVLRDPSSLLSTKDRVLCLGVYFFMVGAACLTPTVVNPMLGAVLYSAVFTLPVLMARTVLSGAAPFSSKPQNADLEFDNNSGSVSGSDADSDSDPAPPPPPPPKPLASKAGPVPPPRKPATPKAFDKAPANKEAPNATARDLKNSAPPPPKPAASKAPAKPKAANAAKKGSTVEAKGPSKLAVTVDQRVPAPPSAPIRPTSQERARSQSFSRTSPTAAVNTEEERPASGVSAWDSAKPVAPTKYSAGSRKLVWAVCLIAIVAACCFAVVFGSADTAPIYGTAIAVGVSALVWESLIALFLLKKIAGVLPNGATKDADRNSVVLRGPDEVENPETQPPSTIIAA